MPRHTKTHTQTQTLMHMHTIELDGRTDTRAGKTDASRLDVRGHGGRLAHKYRLSSSLSRTELTECRAELASELAQAKADSVLI